MTDVQLIAIMAAILYREPSVGEYGTSTKIIDGAYVSAVARARRLLLEAGTTPS